MSYCKQKMPATEKSGQNSWCRSGVDTTIIIVYNVAKFLMHNEC